MEKSSIELLTKAKSLINARRGNDIDLTHALILIDMALKKISWISVENELPKIKQELLVFGEPGIFIDEYNGDMPVWASHWMPLPEPPAESEK
jgi:hypothetical protein